MADTMARWSISLNCDCPKCEELVNLVDYPDFWHGHQFEAGHSKDMEVICPACNHEFTVDCEY